MRAQRKLGRYRAQMSEEAFKNVQLLKGIPVDEFMGAMGLFSAAVSMCCLECHAPDWGRRHAEKDHARKDDSNGEHHQSYELLDESRQLLTCHRQSDRPQVTPTLDVVYGEPIYGRPMIFSELLVRDRGALMEL